MTALNMEEIDKTNFKTFELSDGSYYFGEIVWIDQNGNIIDEKVVLDYQIKYQAQEDIQKQKEEEERQKASKSKPAANQKKPGIEIEEKSLLPPNLYKRVRHGVGVQIFQSESQSDFLCKYEGYWEFDRKNGEGKCYFPDKSVYLGQMKNDIMDGYGQYSWSNGDVYQGNWKNGRFEGGGKFVHHDGNKLQGLFKNNYFHKGGDLYVNPMMENEELTHFIEHWQKSDIIKERNFNKKLFNYAKVCYLEDVIENIKSSVKNKRIALILSSKQLAISKNEILDSICKYLKTPSNNEFDLRYAYHLKKTEGSVKDYMENIRTKLGNLLFKGGVFIINIDDCEKIIYEENYDPDIRQFYSSTHFPSQIWHLDKLARTEVFEKVCSGNDFKMAHLSKEFYPIVWSKYRIDQDLDRDKVLDRFKARFSNIIPIEKCDLILLKEEIEVKNDKHEEINEIDEENKNNKTKLKK